MWCHQSCSLQGQGINTLACKTARCTCQTASSILPATYKLHLPSCFLLVIQTASSILHSTYKLHRPSCFLLVIQTASSILPSLDKLHHPSRFLLVIQTASSILHSPDKLHHPSCFLLVIQTASSILHTHQTNCIILPGFYSSYKVHLPSRFYKLHHPASE